MGYIKKDTDQSHFVVESFGADVPKDHESRFIKEFIKDKFSFLDEETKNKEGRPAFKKTSLIALLIYAEYDDITDYEKISKYCDANKYYNFIMDGLIPSGSTLQQFIREYGYIFELVNKKLLLQLDTEDFAYYNTVTVDAKILNKNDNYVVDPEDIRQLERLIPKNPTKEKIEKLASKLSITAYMILTNTYLTNEEKLRYTKFLEDQLERSEDEKLRLNSKDVKEIFNNKKEIRLTYNRQYTVEYNSKLITKLNLEPNIIDMDDYLKLVKDDNSREDLKLDIKQYMKDREASVQENVNTKLDNTNSFIEYSDNTRKNEDFTYNYENDTYTCMEYQQLPLQKTITQKQETNDKPATIRKTYTPVDCSNCQYKEDCIQEVVREIPDYRNIKQKPETEPSKHSLLVENKLNLKIVTYNLKRILNIEYEIKKKNRHMVLFMNQLKKENPDIKFEVTIK